MSTNTIRMIDLLRDAEGVGIALERLSSLLGVSRQTLYKWREVASKLKPGESAAEMLAKRTPEGHFIHYKG